MFDPIGLGAGLRGAKPPFQFRGDAASDFEKFKPDVLGKSLREINKARESIFLKRFNTAPACRPEQYNAANQAFIERKPYLDPTLRIPRDATVTSLLAEKDTPRDDGYTWYGKARVKDDDVALFEKMQGELAGIGQSIATRQLYQ